MSISRHLADGGLGDDVTPVGPTVGGSSLAARRNSDAAAVLADDADAAAEFCPVPPHLLSRLLYANPVCVLISHNSSAQGGHAPHNAMVISWLTAVDNDGTFIMSVNRKRHTLVNLLERKVFSLSPAVEGLESLLVTLGSSSGRENPDKLCSSGAQLSTTLIESPRSKKRSRVAELESAPPPCVAASPARIACRVRCEMTRPIEASGKEPYMDASSAASSEGVHGHALLLCEIVAGFVDERYWDGKLFAPRQRGAPRLLSFQGSKVFAALEPLPPRDGPTQPTE